MWRRTRIKSWPSNTAYLTASFSSRNTSRPRLENSLRVTTASVLKSGSEEGFKRRERADATELYNKKRRQGRSMATGSALEISFCKHYCSCVFGSTTGVFAHARIMKVDDCQLRRSCLRKSPLFTRPPRPNFYLVINVVPNTDFRSGGTRFASGAL